MQQFIDFLGSQSPYDALEPEELQRLAAHVTVEFFAAGATILDPRESPIEHIFVIRKGLVQLVDHGRIIDELGTGETFGQIALLTGLPPGVEVRAVEETLCYLIPDPRELLAHPEHLYARYSDLEPRSSARGNATHIDLQRPVARIARAAVTVRADISIREAAKLASDQGHSCLFVDYGGGDYGIVTDTDYRLEVATGNASVDAPVGLIAHRPLQSVSETTNTGQAFAEMLRYDIHHLGVLNGRGEPIGVLRVLDVGAAELRGPLALRASVEQAEDIEALTKAALKLGPVLLDLRDRDVPTMHIAGLMSAVRDSIVRRAILLHDDSDLLQQHAWLVMGSQARREPLPLSDIDTALIVSDDLEESDLTDLRTQADAVLTTLERCGLPRCPDGANATNPLFSRTRGDWLLVAKTWTRRPNTDTLLLSAMVADSRPVVRHDIGNAVLNEIARWASSRDFSNAMLAFALAKRPPTGFVRDFVVESSGEHRGQLDLKRRGLRPVVSLGQWIALATGSFQGSTVERLRHGAAQGLLTSDEADTLSGAYLDMYRLLFDTELAALRGDLPTTTYLNPARLDSLSRRHLRESFRAIAKVQSRLEGWLTWIR